MLQLARSVLLHICVVQLCPSVCPCAVDVKSGSVLPSPLPDPPQPCSQLHHMGAASGAHLCAFTELISFARFAEYTYLFWSVNFLSVQWKNPHDRGLAGH